MAGLGAGPPSILEPMSVAPFPLERFYSVIPAGGVGSRLWPLSRADAPKFLHDLTGSGQTLLKDTWDRLAPISGEQRIMVVTGRAHRAAVESQLPGLADANVVLGRLPADRPLAGGFGRAPRGLDSDHVVGMRDDDGEGSRGGPTAGGVSWKLL